MKKLPVWNLLEWSGTVGPEKMTPCPYSPVPAVSFQSKTLTLLFVLELHFCNVGLIILPFCHGAMTYRCVCVFTSGRASIWFVPVRSMQCVCGSKSMPPTCGFQFSRNPLALLAKSPFFTLDRYRHDTLVYTQVYSAFAWRPLEHCVDKPCAMLG